MNTIIFDLDGTIADVWPIERTVLVATTKKPHRNLIQKCTTAHARGLKSLPFLFSILSPNETTSEKEFYSRYEKTLTNLIQENNLPHIPFFLSLKLLTLLKKKSIQCALVTGSSRREAEYILAKNKCRDFFAPHLLLCQNECSKPKKTGEPFLLLKKRITGTVVVLGDSLDDSAGAQRANLPFIHVKNYPQKSPNSLTCSIQQALKLFY